VLDLLVQAEEQHMATMKRRISEVDLIIPALIELKKSPVKWLSTSSLIEKLIVAMKPEGDDAQQLGGRADSKFSQIVRNMISHKDVAGNIIFEGSAEHMSGGLKITEHGLLHLKSRGF
jgi:hypothetical protein